MTELDVVNDMLATMGISPLNQLDDNNPDVANCLRILNTQSERIQAQSWWFNYEQIDLFPDAESGFIYIPGDTIRCDPVRREPLLPITQRGLRLYDTDRNTYDFTGWGKVTCWLVRKIPFDMLPLPARHAISLASVRKFQQSFDADPQKMQRLDSDYLESMIRLRAEHSRHTRPNLLNKPSTMGILNRINGHSYRWY